MPTNHVTARGEPVDMDRLRISNETSIAVGNMKVNARGDQLGPGGKIIKTRSQVMAEKNKLHNAPIADDFEILETSEPEEYVNIRAAQPTNNLQSNAEETPVIESTSGAENSYQKPRGSFADAVAKQTEVKQQLLDPSEVLQKNHRSGVKRI